MDEQQAAEQTEQAETTAKLPAKKVVARKRIGRKPRAKRQPKQMDEGARAATNKVAGMFTAEMLSAGASVVRIKELDIKRHGATGFAEWPDKTRVTLTITSKG